MWHVVSFSYLDCAAKARHTLAWQDPRIPFSAKDVWANINQTGNQRADGLFLSKLLRPLIPTHPFSTHCFTCLIEAQVIEIQSAKGRESPGIEVRMPVSAAHAVTCTKTSQNLKSLMKWWIEEKQKGQGQQESPEKNWLYKQTKGERNWLKSALTWGGLCCQGYRIAAEDLVECV